MSEMMNDYLGWKYGYLASIAVFVLAFLVIFIIVAYNKKKNRKVDLKRKWWFWAIGAVPLIHFAFMQYINPSYTGYGTPDQFTRIYITDNSVVLFDERVTRFDDDDKIHNYLTGHLRIHVVNRNTGDKTYSHLIGDNYSAYQEMGNVYLFSNTLYSSNDKNNTVNSVSRFSIEKKELILLAERGSTISVGGESIEVHEVYERSGVFIKSTKGVVYRLDGKSDKFEFYEGNPEIQKVERSAFELRASVNSADQKVLFIGKNETQHNFLLGDIISEYSTNNDSYALIKYFDDLNKSTSNFALLNSEGIIRWDINLSIFEKKFGTTNLKGIQVVHFYEDVCYLTLDEYLAELDLKTGAINWWTKI